MGLSKGKVVVDKKTGRRAIAVHKNETVSQSDFFRLLKKAVYPGKSKI